MAASKSAARRLIGSGGAYVNNERVGDVAAVLGEQALAGRRTLVLRLWQERLRASAFRVAAQVESERGAGRAAIRV